MANQENRSFSYYMRALHRDIGFFAIGLCLVYAISGIVLVYRDTDFLLRDVQVERKLDPNLEPAEIGPALRIRGFQVEKTEGDIIYFAEGTYNKATGIASYQRQELPTVVQACVSLHKTYSGKSNHWCAILFGLLLSFLAISSFWMYQKGTRNFRRGIGIASAGVLVTAGLLLL